MGIFGKSEKARSLDAAVRATAKPATALIVERAVPPSYEFAATSTHFGNEPYAEDGEPWPTWSDGRPYDFVCQIGLQDCGGRPDVRLDLITVFLCWAAIEAVDIDNACVVRTYRQPSEAKAVRLSRPKPINNDDYQVVGCTVRTEQRLTFPWDYKDHPGIVETVSKFRNPVRAYGQSLARLGYSDPFFSHVGGYPAWVQDNTLEYGDLEFLAQIAYEPQANNSIGDAAPIYIAVSRSDPRRVETDAFQSF